MLAQMIIMHLIIVLDAFLSTSPPRIPIVSIAQVFTTAILQHLMLAPALAPVATQTLEVFMAALLRHLIIVLVLALAVVLSAFPAALLRHLTLAPALEVVPTP
jgi:hypothetical protein